MDFFSLSIPSALSTLGVSTLVVAIAEIGDKTQLLALLLAARFRRPWPIIAVSVASSAGENQSRA